MLGRIMLHGSLAVGSRERSMPRHLIILLLTLLLGSPVHAGQLRFVTEDFPPFTYAASDNPKSAAGPLVEIVAATCARLGHDCPTELLPWRRALVLAETGKAHGIFTVIRSPEREKHLHITRMLVKSRYSVYVRESSTFIYHRPQDLANRIVGVYGPSGTSYTLSQTLHQVPGVTIHLTPNNRRLLKMLDSGRFGEDGLVVANQDVAWHLIEEEKLPGVREAGELGEVAYGIGLSRASVDAAQFQRFSDALDALIEDGTIPAILRRYRLEPAW